jgi:hypothetical protein
VLTDSRPKYNKGWEVNVTKTGRIDGKYDYLFYEAAMVGIPELKEGICIERDCLPEELGELLFQIGLNTAELDDLFDYWLDRLQDYEYYKVYPFVQPMLQEWVELEISPRPESLLRFWLFFQGCEEFVQLSPFSPAEFERRGSTVVEWGGVLIP